LEVAMKKILNYFIISLVGLFSIACQSNDDYDDTPPNPPKNLIVTAGDNKTEISWDENRESDLSGYNIYYSLEYDGKYELIGNSEVNYFVDKDAVNGEKYFYAVTAYDYNGNESELSYDYIYGISRPEGFNQTVFDYLKYPTQAGYSLSKKNNVPFDDLEADFFFENYNGTFYLNVWSDTDIQDMGETVSLYDINAAPMSGWVPMIDGENVKYTEAKIGHTYIIWTLDNHFAKIRVTQITSQRLVFDWAYQMVEGERQLKREIKLRDGKMILKKN